MSFIASILAAIFGDMFKTVITTPKETFSTNRKNGQAKITLSADSVRDKYRHIIKLRDSAH